jgi:hypothetical protein
MVKIRKIRGSCNTKYLFIRILSFVEEFIIFLSLRVDFIANEKGTYIIVKMIEYSIIKTIRCLYENVSFFPDG